MFPCLKLSFSFLYLTIPVTLHLLLLHFRQQVVENWLFSGIPTPSGPQAKLDISHTRSRRPIRLIQLKKNMTRTVCLCVFMLQLNLRKELFLSIVSVRS